MNRVPDIIVELPTGWRRIAVDDGTVWCRGTLTEAAIRRAFHGTGPSSPESFKQVLAGLSGHFALIAQFPDWRAAAVDRARTIPVIWCVDEVGRLRAAQEGHVLRSTVPDRDGGIDPGQALAVALSGYTIGAATLYRNIHGLTPGRYVFQQHADSALSEGAYHRFRPWLADQTSQDDALEMGRAADLTLEILETTVARADGRPIAVPLSAGLDSRLIASGLKHLGYKNVLCFAYGLKGNHEAETSKTIAARLGYPWRFVPYDNKSMSRVFASAGYDGFRQYSDSLTGVHFPQDYRALTALLDDGYLPRESLLVNGQSGDFITGNHIPKSMIRSGRNDSSEKRESRIVDALIAKHYKQWRFLMRPDLLAKIGDMLRSEIAEVTDGPLPSDPTTDYGVYEDCEFIDRQAKYVINGQRVYEYLGIDWDLPLWDDRYVDYWSERPLSQKAGQRLYREMLVSQNWGGVWSGIPVNAKRIRPRWMIPIRLACKIAHAPLGRDRWHEFERRFLTYPMTSLCGYSVRSWSQIAFDTRGPWTAISPHIEDYLNEHGISLESIAA